MNFLRKHKFEVELNSTSYPFYAVEGLRQKSVAYRYRNGNDDEIPSMYVGRETVTKLKLQRLLSNNDFTLTDPFYINYKVNEKRTAGESLIGMGNILITIDETSLFANSNAPNNNSHGTKAVFLVKNPTVTSVETDALNSMDIDTPMMELITIDHKGIERVYE